MPTHALRVVKSAMSGLIDEAIAAITRPPRMSYELSDLPMFFASKDGQNYMRHPLLIENSRKQNIVGSLYHSTTRHPMEGGPCVIYMHGNASSQLEGQFLVPNLCRYGVSVFCYDSVGCGCSEGEFISLGFYEREDINFLMRFLHSTFSLGPFALWGRSMGAATAVMAEYQLLKLVIVDSAYASLRELIAAIGVDNGVPSLLMTPALWMLKRKIESGYGFDINGIRPIDYARKATWPALFGHARRDEFVPFAQGEALYNAWKGEDKRFVPFRGGHNSARNDEWTKLAIGKVLEVFGISPGGEIEVVKVRAMKESQFHFNSYEELVRATEVHDVDKGGDVEKGDVEKGDVEKSGDDEKDDDDSEKGGDVEKSGDDEKDDDDSEKGEEEKGGDGVEKSGGDDGEKGGDDDSEKGEEQKEDV